MGMLNVVMPVLVMLGIGMVCREKKLISPTGAETLQTLVMNFCLPANLFYNFYKNRIDPETILFPLVLFVLTAGGIYVGKLLCRLFHEQDESLPFMLTGYEAGMLGYTLLALLAGAEQIRTFAVMDVGHSLAIFTIYIAMVKNVGGEKQTMKEALAGLCRTPVLIAVFAGLVLGVSGIGGWIGRTAAGELIDTVCTFIATPTGAMILVVIGFRMNFKNVSWGRILKAIGLRIGMQLLFFGAVFVIFRAIGGIFAKDSALLTVGIMLILPPPYILPLYIRGEDKKEFYSSALSVYTLLTILGFIAIAGVLYLN